MHFESSRFRWWWSTILVAAQNITWLYISSFSIPNRKCTVCRIWEYYVIQCMMRWVCCSRIRSTHKIFKNNLWTGYNLLENIVESVGKKRSVAGNNNFVILRRWISNPRVLCEYVRAFFELPANWVQQPYASIFTLIVECNHMRYHNLTRYRESQHVLAPPTSCKLTGSVSEAAAVPTNILIKITWKFGRTVRTAPFRTHSPTPKAQRQDARTISICFHLNVTVYFELPFFLRHVLQRFCCRFFPFISVEFGIQRANYIIRRPGGYSERLYRWWNGCGAFSSPCVCVGFQCARVTLPYIFVVSSRKLLESSSAASCY